MLFSCLFLIKSEEKSYPFIKMSLNIINRVKRGKGLGSMLSLAGSKTCSIRLNGIICGYRGGYRRTEELTSIPRQYFIEETRSTLHEGN